MILLSFVLFFQIASTAQFSGDGTYYAEEGSTGACGFQQPLLTGKSRQYNVAINVPQWDDGMACGRCVQIKGDKATAVAMVTNQCPGCSLQNPFCSNGCRYGDLDMSGYLWKALFNEGYGRQKIQWDYIDCPRDYASGVIHYRIETGSNPWYFAIIPYDFSKPLKSVEIKFGNGGYLSMDHDKTFGVRYVYGHGISYPFTLRTTYQDGSVDITAPQSSFTGGGIIVGGGSSGGNVPQPTTEAAPFIPPPTTQPSVPKPNNPPPKPNNPPPVPKPMTLPPKPNNPPPKTSTPKPTTPPTPKPQTPKPNNPPPKKPKRTPKKPPRPFVPKPRGIPQVLPFATGLPLKWWTNYETCKLWFSGSLCQQLSQNRASKFTPPSPSGSWHHDPIKCRKYFSWSFCSHLIGQTKDPMPSCNDPYATAPNTWWTDRDFCTKYLSTSVCHIIGCQISSILSSNANFNMCN